jgi:hypothetical protein
MYLRKLTPIEDLIAGAPAANASSGVAGAPKPRFGEQGPVASRPRTQDAPVTPKPRGGEGGTASPLASRAERLAQDRRVEPPPPRTPAPPARAESTAAAAPLSTPSANLKDALLSEIRTAKPAFYNMVVAQAQKIEVAGDRVIFTFSASQRALRDRLETDRAWLETMAQRLAGRRITVAGMQADGSAAPPAAEPNGAAPKPAADKKAALREQALADAGVQTMLEVFPAEIRDVEEM